MEEELNEIITAYYDLPSFQLKKKCPHLRSLLLEGSNLIAKVEIKREMNGFIYSYSSWDQVEKNLAFIDDKQLSFLPRIIKSKDDQLFVRHKNGKKEYLIFIYKKISGQTFARTPNKSLELLSAIGEKLRVLHEELSNYFGKEMIHGDFHGENIICRDGSISIIDCFALKDGKRSDDIEFFKKTLDRKIEQEVYIGGYYGNKRTDRDVEALEVIR